MRAIITYLTYIEIYTYLPTYLRYPRRKGWNESISFLSSSSSSPSPVQSEKKDGGVFGMHGIALAGGKEESGACGGGGGGDIGD